jgi:hypothetical protein
MVRDDGAKTTGKTEIEFVKIVFRINYLENDLVFPPLFYYIFCQQIYGRDSRRLLHCN